MTTAERARLVRERMPPEGLFAAQNWRISPTPFPIGHELAVELESLGRIFLQFNRATNLLYRQSLAGKQPSWISEWLDQGKPQELLELQRSAVFKNDLPRVIRPDILLNDAGATITELDSVPGGIGLTAWLNRVYSQLPDDLPPALTDGKIPVVSAPVIGGANGMLQGFGGIFGDANNVHIVVSDEAGSYRPEMHWLAEQLGPRFQVRDSHFSEFADGDAIYRFFELFDVPNVPNSNRIFEMALAKQIRLTPPPKPLFEEKMLFALLWNRNLRGFWRQELGERFLERLLKWVPYTWMVDPAPLPPQGAIPEINLTDWNQLKTLSQKDRQLILKISGFSENAWGARGVYLGSDLSTADWSAAVDLAISSFGTSPHVLQRYHKPRLVESAWYDFDKEALVPMPGRVRLSPYYFVTGENDAARANLGGILATICPADKKIIHGMTDAILAPCSE